MPSFLLTFFIALTLTMKGEAIGATVTVKLAVSRQQATNVIAGISSIEKPVKKIAEKGELWSTLFDRLDALVGLGDQLAEVRSIKPKVNKRLDLKH